MTTDEYIQNLRDLVKFAIHGNVTAVDEILQKSINIDVYMHPRDGKINQLMFTPLHCICYSLIGANPIKQIMALFKIISDSLKKL